MSIVTLFKGTQTMTKLNFHELKPKISLMLKEKGYDFFPRKDRYAEVYLPVDDESIPSQALPKADFAAQFSTNYLFIEVDEDQGVSHNIAKYFYVLDHMKAKPKGVLVLHILGPGFLASDYNYIFHRKLAVFVAEKIRKTFENDFEFHYSQSEPVSTNEEALEWLTKKLSVPFDSKTYSS